MRNERLAGVVLELSFRLLHLHVATRGTVPRFLIVELEQVVSTGFKDDAERFLARTVADCHGASDCPIAGARVLAAAAAVGLLASTRLLVGETRTKRHFTGFGVHEERVGAGDLSQTRGVLLLERPGSVNSSDLAKGRSWCFQVGAPELHDRVRLLRRWSLVLGHAAEAQARR